jgi:hypothetical protein
MDQLDLCSLVHCILMLPPLHCRGVRQGDLLSLKLFLLAIDPLDRLFKKAQQLGLLEQLSNGCEAFRVSLFTDVAAVFIKPTPQDLQVVTFILSVFAQASGLQTDLEKT